MRQWAIEVRRSSMPGAEEGASSSRSNAAACYPPELLLTDHIASTSTHRYDGTDPEPRAGLSSGHIPSSLSLPFPSLVETIPAKREGGQPYTVLKDQIPLYRTLSTHPTNTYGQSQADEDGSPLLDFEKLRQASSAGEPAVTATCGSGMTAAVIWLALRSVGVQSAIYDESWSVSRIEEKSDVV